MQLFQVQPFHHQLSLTSWAEKNPRDYGAEVTAGISGGRVDGAKEPFVVDCNTEEADMYSHTVHKLR
jgi:hypothetical protein